MPNSKGMTSRRARPAKPLVRRGRASSRSSDSDDGEWALLHEIGMSSEVWFMLRLAQLAMLDYVNSGPTIGMPHSQLIVLRLIAARPGLSQQRVANALRIKKANLTPIVDELVAQNLVVRKNSPTLPRAYALHLTAKGEQSLKKAKQIIHRHMSALDDILDQTEKEQLVRFLGRIAVELPLRAGKSG